MTISNEHIPTDASRQRITDLSCAGIPLYLIADIVDLNEVTVRKHYRKELSTAQAQAVERITKTVYQQAVEGDSKAQALYLKTQGAKFGFVEKQVVENVDSADTQALKEQVKALEDKYHRDF